ncbi:unnamed protein product [Prunus armeniaca]
MKKKVQGCAKKLTVTLRDFAGLIKIRILVCICLSVANLAAWCSGKRGCASTRDVLFLDVVRLCAGVPARSTVRRDDDEVRVEDGLNVAPVLNSTPNQRIVAE